MKFKYIFVACLMSFAAASSARAADVVVPSPESSYYPYSFDGLYGGLQLGGSWINQGATIDSLLAQSIDSSGVFINSSGFLGGLYLGYNHQFGNNFVASIETDFAYGNVADNRHTLLNGATINNKLEEQWNGATRVRFGYAFDRLMPYIAGGVSYVQIKNTLSSTNDPVSYGLSETKTGFTVGAGLDYAVSDNVLLRLEYRYGNYGKSSFNIDDTNPENKVTTKYSTNDVRVGIAYKF